jgi:hypothetical protein
VTSYGGKSGDPLPGAGGRATAHLIDQEYGRATAEYVLAEAARQTVTGAAAKAKGPKDRFIRWTVMFDVLRSLGIHALKGTSLDEIERTAPPSGPARFFYDHTVPSERDSTLQWMARAAAEGVTAGRRGERILPPKT